jgi:ribosomal protein L11 methyltransferase
VSWLQVHITIDRGQAPLVEQLLAQQGALSVTYVDAADDPMYEPPLGAMPLWAATRVTGLFPPEQDVDRLRMHLSQGLAADGHPIAISVLEDRDWERTWLKRFKPMRFGRRLWVCPTGQAVARSDAVVVSLDPGLAFGTGTHPTTALCLSWLDHTPLAGRTLIDVGCGSGILGIAAARLGAKRVLALDHDPQAVTATRQNAQRNAVEDRIDVRLGSGGPIPSGDIVVANILANVLIENRTRLIAAIAGAGKIAMSGILETQVDAVRSHFNHAIDFGSPTLQEGWALLVGERRD